MAIHFLNQDVKFTLKNKTKIRYWISAVINQHKKQLGVISYLFCDDEHIYDINVSFLKHNTYTDIITFDYVEGDTVSGDIVISVERVKDNARSLGVPFEQELHRVIIHGVLHLLGFKDKNPKDAALMRRKEEECLILYDRLSDSVSRETIMVLV